MSTFNNMYTQKKGEIRTFINLSLPIIRGRGGLQFTTTFRIHAID